MSNYHQAELAVALDPSNPAHSLPEMNSRYRRILDVGCGAGQSLLAARLGEGVEGYGVDFDGEAIELGRSHVPANIHLQQAPGEALPFEDEYFDLVFSRVSLPYMNMRSTLAEISRVLKVGGDVWFELHPASMIVARLGRSAGRGNVRDVAFTSLVLANGLLFNLSGAQFRFFGRQETYQTASGMARAMKRVGLSCSRVEDEKHFIVQGTKV